LSDQQLGMKMVEQEELNVFLEAYEFLRGERLRLHHSGERPDFICLREDGRPIGVELTAVMRDPESAFYDRVIRHRDFMNPYEAQERLLDTILKKDLKRVSTGWTYPDSTVLVLQMHDCPLSEICWLLDEVGPKEFAHHGFEEVVIADYSELDAYGVVELYGLYPQDLWGYHKQNRGKPYG